MGIFIKLEIVPDKISLDSWNSTYKEAVKLIQAYPFLDIVSQDLDNCSWNYADTPTETPIQYCQNNIGFRLFGDLITMHTAESFELIKDLNYYREPQSEHKCKDILQLYTDNLQGIKTVFNDKTQGYDYHQYILAIACLLENRLQPYALVLGDISKGQMEAAVEWANSILEQPIQISQRANQEILLTRIKKLVPNELEALKIFMEATLNEKDKQLGCFIKMNFAKNTIINYYIEEITQYKVGTFGFSDRITEYLNLGNDLTDLCDICITKDSSPEIISSFINKIFDLGIHLDTDNNQRLAQAQLKEVRTLHTDNPSSRIPDTIPSLFGKFLFTMATSNRGQTDIYIPLDKVIEIFKEKFGNFCDVDTIINKYFDQTHKEQELHSTTLSTPLLPNEKEYTIENYDIETLDDLIL